ncbi:hypothetical protein [Dialister pneumosintes]|jgi:hypothetical protein|uniref:Uncharacterized protein n=1 Tax=Dialister pneumosintes TaxID=39950 RepID=A0A1B3WDY9_9FIRM|nr:hypothetical protein [Dialister pneumosintes]AOH39179.1 hypothetical protein BCB69_03880 [Dialister pneumosintes]
MNLIDLEKILTKENIWKYDYAIGTLNKPLSETPICLIKDKGGFVYLELERDKVVYKEVFDSEDKACKFYLTKYSRFEPRLKKYVN